MRNVKKNETEYKFDTYIEAEVYDLRKNYNEDL